MICLHRATTAAGGRKLQCNTYARQSLVDPATGKVLAEQPGLGIVVAPDGKRMATTTLEAENACLHIWDLGTGKEIQTLKLPKRQGETPDWTPQVRAFTPDGQSLIIQSEIVSVWDVSSGKQKSSWNLLQNKLMKDSLDATVQAPESLPPGQRGKAQSRIKPGGIRAVAVSPDGSKIAFAINWQVHTNGSKTAPPNESKKIFEVPDYIRNFSRLLMFETVSGKLLHQYDVDDMVSLGNLYSKPDAGHLAFSPDNKLLAVAGSFRGAGGAFNVQVWDSETGKTLHRFQGHRGPVNTLAFSSDSKRLASASEDSTALIWDLSK
jgi:WD40 repeat protein